MASIVYVGQTVLITTQLKGKPIQGTAIVISKYIEKNRILFNILAMDGNEYGNISSDQLAYICTKKKSQTVIYHGIACTFKLMCSMLAKSYVKTEKKKLMDHLREVWHLLNKGELVSDSFLSKEEEKKPEETKVVAEQ